MSKYDYNYEEKPASAMMDSFVFMMVPLFLCFLVRVYSTVIQRYTSGPK